MTVLSHLGHGLARPESVLAIAHGDVFTSDRRGGIAWIDVDGGVKLVRARGVPEDFLANGIALTPDGSFLVANLAPSGGVYRLDPSGQAVPFLTEVEGRHLGTANFVSLDREGRVWIAVSTRQVPRELAFRRTITDGYLVVNDHRGSRIVAEGLSFTNESVVDPQGRYLYVAETIGRRVVRFPLRGHGELGPVETVVQFDGDGIFPDGLGFDVDGGVWVVSVVSNRVVRIGSGGERVIVIDDADPGAVERAEQAFAEDRFLRDDIDGGRFGRLGNTSSMAFAGLDLRTVYLGSIYSDRLWAFRSPVAGVEPVHWHVCPRFTGGAMAEGEGS